MQETFTLYTDSNSEKGLERGDAMLYALCAMRYDITSLTRIINKEISSYNYGDAPKELYEPIRYILALGGKRLRPLLTLLGNYLFSDNILQAIKPAAGIELFHNFTLMHDDIMDAAPLRRGKPSVHNKWDQNIAILSGDVMLIKSYELISQVADDKIKKVIGRFNECASKVCKGQQLDLNFEKVHDVSIHQYIEMITYKTAALLGFSIELGAIIGDADEKDAELLREFGTNVGIGFQIKDDLLDVYAEQGKSGKLVGGDIIANKKTFLLLLALQNANKYEYKALNDWLNIKNSQQNGDKKVKAITEIYDSLNIKKDTEKEMSKYFQKSFETLEKVSSDAEKIAILKDFATKLIDRDR